MNSTSMISRRMALLTGLGSAAATLLPGIAAFAQETKTKETTMKTSTIAGPQGQLATYSVKAGDGLPILFLHGDSSRASHWDQVVALTATGRDAVTFDFRGHGASDPAADADYSYDGRAMDVGAVADAYGLRKFLIVAHSGGCGVALAFAARHADRVPGLLLVDPATDPRALPKDMREGFARDLAGPKSLEVQNAYYISIAGPDAAVRARVLADAAVVDPAARAGAGKALAEWDPEAALNAYQGPMLVLVSEANDNPAAIYRLRTNIPHQLVAGVGHWVMLDKPEVVAEAVNTFVATVETGQR